MKLESIYGFKNVVTFRTAPVLPWMIVAITFREDSMPCYNISHGSENCTVYESELILWSERQMMGFEAIK